MKKVVVLVILIFLAVGTLILSNLSPKNTGIRTNLIGYDSKDVLDPVHLRFIQEYFILDNVTVKLIGTGSDNQYSNELAQEIIFSNDKKTIDVLIRDANFSDGTPITATDVAASLKRTVILGSPHANIKNLWLGSENLKSISDEIEGIKVLSPKKLQFKLSRVTKELLFFLSLTDMAILHKSQYTKEKLTSADWMQVTSGAYRIGYNKDNKMSLYANPKTLTFNSKMPQSVTFESYKGDDVMARLRDKSLDFGMITFKDYLSNAFEIEKIDGFDIVGNKTDGVTYIGLNVKSPLFAKAENRQWIQKKIIKSFAVSEKYKKAATKAIQFFLPNAKGHISTAKIESMLSGVDVGKVPKDLQAGITIKTIEGMKDYIPEDLEDSLSNALGIPVRLQANIPNRDFPKFMHDRNFDATMMGFGMSYKVLGEALNLQYLSKDSFLLDPTGTIKTLLKQYQNEDDSEKEEKLIQQILEQMVSDSECVPLFYFSAPFFVKSDRLKASELDLDESVKFYKAEIK